MRLVADCWIAALISLRLLYSNWQMVASEPRCTRICPVRGRLSSSGNVIVITIGDFGVSFFLDMGSSRLKFDTDENGGYPLPYKSNRAPSGAVLLCIPLFHFG